MTRDEFIELLKINLEPDAEMNFLICDLNKPMIAFLNIFDVCMNADIDDSRNYNCGGVIFTIKKELTT